MKAFLIFLSALGFAHMAAAQTADDYRGGWRTDQGEPHTYEFSIRGDKVRGIYCTWCADATTLAFVDGSLGAGGIAFVVTHVKANGSTAYQDKATAKFDHGKLIVTGSSGAPGGGKFTRILIKDPRGPDPLPVIVSVLPKGPPVPAVRINQQGLGAPSPRYIQPGPWKSRLTESDVIGVWLGFGTGAPKQYFIIKKAGNKLRGMVCGTCDNPYTMAALDDFEIQGDTLKFNILHEDWGDGELPTFYKHVTARVGWNEMRCTTAADHQPPPTAETPKPRLCARILAGRTHFNRGHGWKRMVRMAAEEHILAALKHFQRYCRLAICGRLLIGLCHSAPHLGTSVFVKVL